MSGDTDRLALAKVGLRALIDEATGFQEERAEDDLRRYARSLGLDGFVEIVEERITLALSALDGSDAA